MYLIKRALGIGKKHACLPTSPITDDHQLPPDPIASIYGDWALGTDPARDVVLGELKPTIVV
jgi:hypothetical protein